MSNIIVTGGAGFIGSHLVDKLIERNHNVLVIDNLSTGNFDNINKKAILLSADITDLDSLRRFLNIPYYKFNKINFIFHLAAQINLRHSFDDPAKDALTNIIGTLNMAKIAKENNARMIFASTGGALYSEIQNNPPWFTWAGIDPKSPYGLSKYTSEKYLKLLDVDHVSLRLSNVYGPRQNHKGEAGAISIFINNILSNQDITIFGDGKQTRDFIYVDDVVNAFITAMGLHTYYYTKAHNVSTGVGTDINSVADMIVNNMDNKSNVIHIDSIPGELVSSVLHPSLPGWKANVNLEDGIKRTIKYFNDI